MPDDIINKRQNEHKRVTGAGVEPFIKHVVGNGTEFGQGYKVGTERNWLDQDSAHPARGKGNPIRTGVLDEAYFRRRG